MRPGLNRETFHAAVTLLCFNPNLKDANHPNGMGESIKIGALSETFVKGPAKTKEKVLVVGEVVDVEGKPYEGVNVSAAGATTMTDASGRFRLEVTPGSVRVTAQSGPYLKTVVSVDATNSVNSTKLELLPYMHASGGRYAVNVELDGLPLDRSVGVEVTPNQVDKSGDCVSEVGNNLSLSYGGGVPWTGARRSSQRVRATEPGTYANGAPRMCVGSYFVELSDRQGVLARTTATVRP
jgi:hypothetical protein